MPAGPAKVFTLGMVPGATDNDLKGVLCQSPNSCETVRYPQIFYPSGADPLNEKIQGTDGLKIVYGYSQGGQVISAWMKKYAAAADAPPEDELVFVIIANGDRKYGGANTDSGYVTPETQYKVIDITRQYDFGSDYPDNPGNFLAWANALAGFSYIHTQYEDVDIYAPENIVWTEGKTTYVFVPTENLPLLEPLRRLGLHALADRLNGPLKEIVERGYNRDYLPQSTPPTEPALETGSNEAVQELVAEGDSTPSGGDAADGPTIFPAEAAEPIAQVDPEDDQLRDPEKLTITDLSDNELADSNEDLNDEIEGGGVDQLDADANGETNPTNGDSGLREKLGDRGESDAGDQSLSAGSTGGGQPTSVGGDSDPGE